MSHWCIIPSVAISRQLKSHTKIFPQYPLAPKSHAPDNPSSSFLVASWQMAAFLWVHSFFTDFVDFPIQISYSSLTVICLVTLLTSFLWAFDLFASAAVNCEKFLADASSTVQLP